jgi:hypothetical protein
MQQIENIYSTGMESHDGGAGGLASVPLGRRASHYGTAAGNVAVLSECLQNLSVTKFQLAGLLDVRPRSYIYRLFSGGRRPSNLYLLRLVRLLLMQAEGQMVFEMQSINWDTGEIRMRPGARHTAPVGRLAPGLVGAGRREPARVTLPSPFSHRPGGKSDGYPYGQTGPVY